MRPFFLRRKGEETTSSGGKSTTTTEFHPQIIMADSTWSLSSSSSSRESFSSSWDDRYLYHVPPTTDAAEPSSERRTVRFCEGDNILVEPRQEDDGDLSKRWFSKKDYRRFKTENTRIVRRILNGKNPWEVMCLNVLQQTYASCCAASETKPETFALSKQCQHELEQLCSRSGPEAVDIEGLECFVVRYKLQDGRKQRLQLLLDAISWFEDPPVKNATPDAVSEELRPCCETISFPCRLFARHMAQAQARSQQVQQNSQA